MPVYEYECGGCSKAFEVQQRIADKPLTICSECGGTLRKLISMTSFQLKGGGWYTDGYSGASNSKGDDASAKDKPAAPEDASVKDKPAAPPCQGGTGSCNHCPVAT